jgi:hypothetical protein
MPVILTFILSFLLFGCANSTPPKKRNLETNESSIIKATALPISPQVKMLESRTAYEENKLIAPDISGEYELETGTDNYKSIAKAHMVIEKLDDTNFGYYYAVQDEKAKASDSVFGIFRYKNEKFLNKVLDKGTTTTLNDNITLITEGQRLKLVVLRSYGKRIIIWSRVLEEDKEIDDILKESLADAKVSYTQIYKEKFDKLTEKEGMH